MMMVSGGAGRTNRNASQIANTLNKRIGTSVTATSRQEILGMLKGIRIRPILRLFSFSSAIAACS
jgi:hypothetical protein